MDVFLEVFNQLMNPSWIIESGGLYLVLMIIFIESGLFFGFFLPGGPVLFISGVVIASANGALLPFNQELLNLTFWTFLFVVAATVGSFTGYWFGHKFGYILQKKKSGWFIKQEHIQAANNFYEKKGGFAVLISRFLPIARTYAPIVGGMVNMDIKRFAFYNVLGALIWVTSLTSLGFILGDTPWVKENLKWIILALVLFVTLPVVFKLFVMKNKESTV